MELPMHTPPHPGEIIREECLEALRLSPAELAQALAVPEAQIVALIEERARVDTDMALRLAKALGTSAEVWLGVQQQYDLWHSRQRFDDSRVRTLSLKAPGLV